MEKVIRGTIVSVGSAKGYIKILKKEEDIANVTEEDIIVVYKSSPIWTVPLLKAKGMICEIGGKVSHIGIICRELGVPCLSNIDNAMELFNEGELVNLDCEKGEIYK